MQVCENAILTVGLMADDEQSMICLQLVAFIRDMEWTPPFTPGAA